MWIDRLKLIKWSFSSSPNSFWLPRIVGWSPPLCRPTTTIQTLTQFTTIQAMVQNHPGQGSQSSSRPWFTILWSWFTIIQALVHNYPSLGSQLSRPWFTIIQALVHNYPGLGSQLSRPWFTIIQALVYHPGLGSTFKPRFQVPCPEKFLSITMDAIVTEQVWILVLYPNPNPIKPQVPMIPPGHDG